MPTIKTHYINEGATFIVESDEHSMSIQVTPDNEAVCNILAACIEEFSQEVDPPLSMKDIKDCVADLRGGIPDQCDFCREKTSEDALHPEEGGMWACGPCLRKWEYKEQYEMIKEDARVLLMAVLSSDANTLGFITKAAITGFQRIHKMHGDESAHSTFGVNTTSGMTPDLLFADPETGEELRPFGPPELTPDGKGMRLRVCNRDGDRKYIHTIYTEEF